jgi:hypothetical protein
MRWRHVADWPSRTFSPLTRYFRFGWERTLVNRMPDECKIGVEVNPKGSCWESRLFVAPAGIRRVRARAPHDANSSSSAFASFRSSVSKPSVNQP